MKTPAPRPAREEITARSRRSPAKSATPKPAIYKIAWINPVTSEKIQIRVTHTRDYLAKGQDHIEVECLKPKGAALPITQTGYRSHFLPALEVVNAGGPATFVGAWIEREAATKAWRQTATAKAQGDLFQWADARKIATGRKRDARASAVTAADDDNGPTLRRKHRKPAREP